MITRRCALRRFWLVPCKKVKQIIMFCLAIAAVRYGIKVHAFCFMSNHYHIIITDTLGNRPEFTRWFHQFTARHLNALWGRWENLWATVPPSEVLLADEGAEIDETVYTLSNPVAAGLVKFGKQWPGLRSDPKDLLQTITVQRPKGFFRENGPLPETASLTLTKLPSLAHLSDRDYCERIDQLVFEKEAKLRAKAQAEGRTFLGRRAVLAQKAGDSPQTAEPRRQVVPRVAAKDKSVRTRVMERLRQFLAAYKNALQRFRDGNRAAVFPAGTYWMARFVGVTVAGYP